FAGPGGGASEEVGQGLAAAGGRGDGRVAPGGGGLPGAVLHVGRRGERRAEPPAGGGREQVEGAGHMTNVSSPGGFVPAPAPCRTSETPFEAGDLPPVRQTPAGRTPGSPGPGRSNPRC